MHSLRASLLVCGGMAKRRRPMTLREFQSKGGKTRVKVLGHAALSAISHRAGQIRWAHWNQEQRDAHMAKMNAGLARYYERRRARIAELQKELAKDAPAN